MLKRLEAGDCVGITPDGPRGPAMVASSGVVNVARLAGVPKDRIINCWPVEKLLEWLKSRSVRL